MIRIGRAAILCAAFLFYVSSTLAQSDTISENFNGICELTADPGRTYFIDYTGESGLEWEIGTLYSSSSWWGGIDDEGNAIVAPHCGSLQWDQSNTGYARARILKGIKSISFQMKYGFQLVDGHVKVLVDGVEVGLTDTLTDEDVHTYTYDIEAFGMVDLEIVPTISESTPGGLVIDNVVIITQGDDVPFFQVDQLNDYRPWMDTMLSYLDTVQIYIYAEHCMEVNGEFVDYFEKIDDVDLTIGSVMELIPGDSIVMNYWGSVTPGIGYAGGESDAEISVSMNSVSEAIDINTSEGDDVKSGSLSFINGDIKYDLIVFKPTDLKNEYLMNFTFNTFLPDTTHKDTSQTDTTALQYNSVPSISFYPNPIQDYAYFTTSKELNTLDVFDIHGKLLFTEREPIMTGSGKYRIGLESLSSGICIIRFIYSDFTMDAVKVIIE